jgi:hypothetical protein
LVSHIKPLIRHPSHITYISQNEACLSGTCSKIKIETLKISNLQTYHI